MIQPRAYLKLIKNLDDHTEEITYRYHDLGKAANIFCDIIRSQTDFKLICVSFNSCPEYGLFQQVQNVSESIHIKGNQFNDEDHSYYHSFYDFVYDFTSKEDSYVKIKLVALKIAKEAKKLEKYGKYD